MTERTAYPDEREHDWGLCWCAKCTKELFEAHDAYLRRWIDKRERAKEPKP